MLSQRMRNIEKLHKALDQKGFYISTNRLDPLSAYNENNRMVNWQDKVLNVSHKGNWLHVPLNYYYSLDENSNWMVEGIVMEFALSFDESLHDVNDVWWTPAGIKPGNLNPYVSHNSLGKTQMWVQHRITQLTGVDPANII